MAAKATKTTKPVVVSRSRDASVRSRVQVGSGDASGRRAGVRGAVTKQDGQRERLGDASKPAALKARPAGKGGPPRRPARVGFVCPPCGRFVPTVVDGLVLRVGRGSPPRFCSPGCRQAAYRRRQVGVAEDTPLQPGGGRDRSLKQTKTTAARPGRKRNA
jgi:hypothetical protein